MSLRADVEDAVDRLENLLDNGTSWGSPVPEDERENVIREIVGDVRLALDNNPDTDSILEDAAYEAERLEEQARDLSATLREGVW